MMATTLNDMTADGAVVVLAAAPSLTDEVAKDALSEFGHDSSVLRWLHSLGLVVPAGVEWRLVDHLRTACLQRSGADSQGRAVHQFFLERAQMGEASGSLPLYLACGVGVAYHGLELDPDAGRLAYREVGHINRAAVSVQARRLALEQASRGLLGLDDVPLLFVQGMALYRSGAQAESMRFLRKVASADEASREVAVAQHLVGYWDCVRSKNDASARHAQSLLRASHKNAVKRDDYTHLAHVKHSMALCMLKNRPRDLHGPVKLLEQSLSLIREEGDVFGEAKVLHSLGQALSHDPIRRDEAQRYLEESLRIGIELGYRRHQALVLESLLAGVLSPQRRAELRSMKAFLSPFTDDVSKEDAKGRGPGFRGRSQRVPKRRG